MSNAVIVMGAAGRMGSMIARLAREEGLTLAAVLDRPEQVAGLAHWNCPAGSDPAPLFAAAPGAVIIDFTAPAVTMATARVAASTGNPMVIGTTGLDAAQKAELAELATRVPLFWSPNMSVGVNVLQDMLPQLVRMLGPDYDIELVEIHHNKKKDAPSGTALRLAESLAEGRDWKLEDVSCCHREGLPGERPQAQIGMQAVRGGDVAGVHTIYFLGQGERIELTHHAHSRENFVHGALRAARWLVGKKPGALYSMQDVLQS